MTPAGRRLALLLALAAGSSATSAEEPSRVTYAGHTPLAETMRVALGIPGPALVDIVEWKVALEQADSSPAGGVFRAEARYGRAIPNRPGLSQGEPVVVRTGRWTNGAVRRGAASFPTFELGALGSLERLSGDVVHFLDPTDRSLMNGTSGESYTLSRDGRAERADREADPAPPPDLSYPVLPVATGEDVEGVFEGRTPCRGAAAALRVALAPGCFKAKWRVTLFRGPSAGGPGASLVEGTLLRASPRRGTWRAVAGSPSTGSRPVIEIRADTGPPIRLLRGDENVLYFIDEKGRILVGTERFAYTLNRRTPGPLKPSARAMEPQGTGDGRAVPVDSRVPRESCWLGLVSARQENS